VAPAHRGTQTRPPRGRRRAVGSARLSSPLVGPPQGRRDRADRIGSLSSGPPLAITPVPAKVVIDSATPPSPVPDRTTASFSCGGVFLMQFIFSGNPPFQCGQGELGHHYDCVNPSPPLWAGVSTSHANDQLQTVNLVSRDQLRTSS